MYLDLSFFQPRLYFCKYVNGGVIPHRKKFSSVVWWSVKFPLCYNTDTILRYFWEDFNLMIDKLKTDNIVLVLMSGLKTLEFSVKLKTLLDVAHWTWYNYLLFDLPAVNFGKFLYKSWNFQNILEYWDCWKKLIFQDDWLFFLSLQNCLPR